MKILGKDRLFELIDKFLAEIISAEEFCNEFEKAFNFEVKKSELSPLELIVFGEIFDKAVWYSSFEDERISIPGYLGEAEIKASVQASIGKLGSGTTFRDG